MLSMYKTAIENHWRKVNDPFLLKHEIPAFQIDKTETGKTRWDHQDGKRDDRIFGDGISYIILNDTESMTRRVQTQFEGEEDELEIDYGYPVGINSSLEQMMGAELQREKENSNWTCGQLSQAETRGRMHGATSGRDVKI